MPINIPGLLTTLKLLTTVLSSLLIGTSRERLIAASRFMLALGFGSTIVKAITVRDRRLILVCGTFLTMLVIKMFLTMYVIIAILTRI